MKTLIKILPIIAILSCVAACGSNADTRHSKSISVTIPPLQGIVKEIVGNDYKINVILPKGATPENYSPTVAQMAAIEHSEYLFNIGTLPFEQQIVSKLKSAKGANIQMVADGIELIEGSCEHGHTHHEHHHSHDPHVWLSMDGLMTIIDNIATPIINSNPDSTKYVANYEAIKQRLIVNKQRYAELLDAAPRHFLIYHPALGYLAQEFGLEQIALENDGKAPTPAGVINIVEKAQVEGLKYMLYQAEYPLDVVKPIAEVLGVKPILINPLSDNIFEELDRIINILAGNYEE